MIAKGTKICCPKCKQPIASAACDIPIGARIEEALFKAIPPQVIKSLMPTTSHCCGVSWFGWQNAGFYETHGKLFTEKGWLP